jgi:hypothetical protein
MAGKSGGALSHHFLAHAPRTGLRALARAGCAGDRHDLLSRLCDGSLIEKLPDEGRPVLRRIGVLTSQGRALMRGCLVFPPVQPQSGAVRCRQCGLAAPRDVVGAVNILCIGQHHALLPARQMPQRIAFKYPAIFAGSPVDTRQVARLSASAPPPLGVGSVTVNFFDWKLLFTDLVFNDLIFKERQGLNYRETGEPRKSQWLE